MDSERTGSLNQSGVWSALQFISADCPRDEWVTILMAIKSELGESGKGLAREWSAISDKFDTASFEATWRSINEQGGIGVGTLFHTAKQSGWLPDGPVERRLPATKTKPPSLTKRSDTATYARRLTTTRATQYSRAWETLRPM